MAPGHYLSQCWLIINMVPWHFPADSSIGNLSITNFAFGNQIFKIKATSPSGQWVIAHLNVLLQERHNSIANALELRLSCTNPSIRDADQIDNHVCLFIGQERFTSMTRVYYKDARACIIMFDLSQRSTFLNALKWKNDLDSKCTLPDGSPVPCILLANKVRHVVQNSRPFCKLQCKMHFLEWKRLKFDEISNWDVFLRV